MARKTARHKKSGGPGALPSDLLPRVRQEKSGGLQHRNVVLRLILLAKFRAWLLSVLSYAGDTLGAIMRCCGCSKATICPAVGERQTGLGRTIATKLMCFVRKMIASCPWLAFSQSLTFSRSGDILTNEFG
jgi:hypothetical protein